MAFDQDGDATVTPNNIITTLRDRRAIEKALRELASTPTDLEMLVRARQIARHSQALPVIMTMLGANDPQLRGGIGQVVAALQAEGVPVAEKLRAVATDLQRPDQERITAITLLERFLGQPPDESLYATLADPQAIVLNSVREVLIAARQSQFYFIEYIQQLETQPLEVALDLVASLDAIAPEERLTLLRLLAQDLRDVVATQAIYGLGRIRLPEAIGALRSLLPGVTEARRALIERSLRKLTLAGVQAPPPVALPPGWRALVSGLDGEGYRAVWFVAPTQATAITLYKPGTVTFLGVLIGDANGLRLCFSNTSLPTVRIPAPHLPGTFSELLIPQTDLPMRLLEVSFEYGRSLVAAAIQLNFERQAPVPHEFRLLNPLIWQFGEPAAPPLPDIPPMIGDLAIANLRRQARTLLDHWAFSSWFVHSEICYDLAERMLDARRPAFPTVEMLLEELAAREFSPTDLAAYRRRLMAMTSWLALAGDMQMAALARHLAASLRPPADLTHPFLIELARIGVERAMSNLRAGYDLRTDPRRRF